MDEFKEIEKKLNYEYKDINLLRRALTHSSYANEKNTKYGNNERLEFLGDSVLGFITAEYFYKNRETLPEGELTKLRAAAVCEGSLYNFAKGIDLGDHIFLGKGEVNTGGNKRPSILADAFEAIIASIYLDGGMDAARDFVLNFILQPNPDKISLNDYKTTLQEVVQKNPEELLEYVLTGESGPDHNKNFNVEVHLNNNIIGKGSGKSKKIAEQQAAKEALELMGL
ncbi:MAG: ribonuclease III [Oscillospiraceae bacterium]|jgi:ribonuclease-3|nr:ribonuclease III [Oscillospiraceae bacterium]